MKSSILFLSLLLSLSACRDERSVLLESISRNEAALQAADSLLPREAKELEASYHHFVKLYPADSLSPALWLKMAQLRSVQEGRYEETVDAYQKLYEDYPDSPEAAEGLIALALFFEAQGQMEMAKGSYRLFLRQYPEHAYATSAAEVLAMMEQEDKSALEQIQEWKKAAKNSP